MDLPRVVKFKQRISKGTDTVPLSAKIGHLYDNFIEFIELHPDLPITQLDTVIGRVGGKVILTIHFVPSDFMVGLLLNNKTATEAAEKIQNLKATLLLHGFSFEDICPLLLTDNGGEFSRISALKIIVPEHLNHIYFSVNQVLHMKNLISKKIIHFFETLFRQELHLTTLLRNMLI